MRSGCNKKDQNLIRKAVAAGWPLLKVQAHLKMVSKQAVQNFYDYYSDMNVVVETPIAKMNAKELEAHVMEKDIDVDLSEYGKIAEKREAVLEAIEEEEE